jgi:hypothetical protein
MLGEFDLLPGEQIVYTIQGDGFFLGANPAAKAIAAIQATLVRLTGGHVRIFVVVTNHRIVLVESRQAFCGVRRVTGGRRAEHHFGRARAHSAPHRWFKSAVSEPSIDSMAESSTSGVKTAGMNR